MAWIVLFRIKPMELTRLMNVPFRGKNFRQPFRWARCFGWSWFLSVFYWNAAADPARLVWRDMNQAALDAAYDQGVYAPNLEQVLSRFDSNSEITRSVLGEPDQFPYGEGPNETMDVFTTGQPDAPIHVFIHGGAWKLGSAEQNAYLAENFVRAGVHFTAPDFSPVQDFGGDLAPMVNQLRMALVWVFQNAEEAFGGDPQRIFLSGFSSGGHLAGVLLTTDWTHYPGVPADLIKGAVLCSGMYDLKPVSLSYRRDYVNFSVDTVEWFSPRNHISRINCPVIVAYGTFETPEFKRQAIEFSLSLKDAGKPVRLLVGVGYNHFEIIETMASPYGLLGRSALEQMGMAPE